MNKEIALEILRINDNNELSYEDKVIKMQSLVGDLTNSHRNILTDKPYAKRNQYILEAFYTLNNFKSTNWIAAEKLQNNCSPKTGPIKFEILTSKNEKMEYCLYNEDQLSQKHFPKDIKLTNISKLSNKNIKKYTANYSYSNSNFVIQN